MTEKWRKWFKGYLFLKHKRKNGECILPLLRTGVESMIPLKDPYLVDTVWLLYVTGFSVNTASQDSVDQIIIPIKWHILLR